MTNFRPDYPIQSKKDDALNWTRYAEFLAGGIRKADVSVSSIVIGLQGQWGSGKSSLKNMSLEQLRELRWDDKFILQFDPWLISASEQLAERFYLDVIKQIEDADIEVAKALRPAWMQFAAITGALRHFAKVFAPLYGAYATASAAHGDLSHLPAAVMINTTQQTLDPPLEAASNASKDIADAFPQNGPTLDKLRQEVKNSLEKLKNPLLIVMDDLDRLTVEELRITFQLIKSNCSFPNLIFLLLFQRDIVESALSETHFQNGHQFGRDFLEKIVQIPLHVPQIPQKKLVEILNREATAVLSYFSLKVENEALVQTINEIADYFSTLRQVQRFIQTFTFTLGAFTSQGKTLIDPTDLLMLEALRYFEPELHAKLARSERWLLINPTMEYEDFLFESLSQPPTRLQRGQDVIAMLFPATRSGRTKSPFRDTSQDALLHRVSQSDVFQNYFTFAALNAPITVSFDETVSMSDS